jgi:nitroimidazol reductase NimA-like FMN-containing flavoprotein (pyridoxamine 5'-phosphate oxidase superfamily)
MRRKDRELSAEEAGRILAKGEFGVLSTVGTDGQPYGIPLSYVYRDNAVYFHCASEGHKLQNLANNHSVSFCVVGRTNVLPAEFVTNYESAVVFGPASEVQGSEKHGALLALLEKYSPDFIENGKCYIEKNTARTKVVKIFIARLTGKARMETARS